MLPVNYVGISILVDTSLGHFHNANAADLLSHYDSIYTIANKSTTNLLTRQMTIKLLLTQDALNLSDAYLMKSLCTKKNIALI